VSKLKNADHKDNLLNHELPKTKATNKKAPSSPSNIWSLCK